MSSSCPTPGLRPSFAALTLTERGGGGGGGDGGGDDDGDDGDDSTRELDLPQGLPEDLFVGSSGSSTSPAAPTATAADPAAAATAADAAAAALAPNPLDVCRRVAARWRAFVAQRKALRQSTSEAHVTREKRHP
jgi:hypothetical protein